MNDKMTLITIDALETDHTVFVSSSKYVNQLIADSSDEAIQTAFELVVDSVSKYLENTIPFYYEGRESDLAFDSARLACLYTNVHAAKKNHLKPVWA